jgi:hypothetical protein
MAAWNVSADVRPWMIGGLVFCAVSAMRTFIDDSNRNWFIHLLDYNQKRLASDDNAGQASRQVLHDEPSANLY